MNKSRSSGDKHLVHAIAVDQMYNYPSSLMHVMIDNIILQYNFSYYSMYKSTETPRVLLLITQLNIPTGSIAPRVRPELWGLQYLGHQLIKRLLHALSSSHHNNIHTTLVLALASMNIMLCARANALPSALVMPAFSYTSPH